jgi:hypothetical protein
MDGVMPQPETRQRVAAERLIVGRAEREEGAEREPDHGVAAVFRAVQEREGAVVGQHPWRV